MDKNLIFGRTLRVFRGLTGMSQTEAAEYFGVSKMQLSRWERGENQINKENRGCLSKLMSNYFDEDYYTLLERAIFQLEIWRNHC